MLIVVSPAKSLDYETPVATKKFTEPTILAFNGDVYMGMDAPNTFAQADFTHAQKTLRILSGLYGVLRPLDLMMPYRLEMGSRVENERGRDLYAFWGTEITERLQADVHASPGAKVLVNLASNEYFGAVKPSLLDVPVVSPAFLDAKEGGDPRIVSFFAKRARGAMSGWIIRNRIKSVRKLREFDALGYRFDAARSSATRPVFMRDAG